MFQIGNTLWKNVKHNLGHTGKKHSLEAKKKMSEAAKRRIGKKASHWQGGRMIIDGYVYIYSPKHPNKTKMGYTCEHRLVMEKFLGRYLEKQEVVHHKNHNKTDNKIENLELTTSTGTHYIKYHAKRSQITGQFVK